MKLWLGKNAIEKYSTHNERKSVPAEQYVRTLQTKIYKYIISVSKNVYIDELDDIVNKYRNTYDKTNEMKPVDVKSSKCVEKIKRKVLNIKQVVMLE